MAPRAAWHLTPRWLRRLAVDADIYQDHDVAAMVDLARRGDDTALDVCRRMAER